MSGLVPVTSTIYVNTNYSYNSNADNVVPAIAANGNVLIGWGDGPPSGSPNLASITIDFRII